MAVRAYKGSMDRRRVVAIAWGLAVALGLASWLASPVLGLTVLWFASLLLLAVSLPLAPMYIDERLELPLAYHTVAAVAFLVPLAGTLLAALPHSSSDMQQFVPFFMLLAWLGYRSLVARNAHQALLLTVSCLLLWVPFGLLFGYEHGSWQPPDWTELVSFRVLFAAQFVTAVASGTALLAFRPRTEGLPEARVRDN
jgi:hypothetical protein